MHSELDWGEGVQIHVSPKLQVSNTDCNSSNSSAVTDHVKTLLRCSNIWISSVASECEERKRAGQRNSTQLWCKLKQRKVISFPSLPREEIQTGCLTLWTNVEKLMPLTTGLRFKLLFLRTHEWCDVYSCWGFHAMPLECTRLVRAHGHTEFNLCLNRAPLIPWVCCTMEKVFNFRN